MKNDVSASPMSTNKLAPAIIPAGILVVLIILSFALNSSALDGYWRWDDSAILYHLHSYSFVDDFISPEIWQELQPSNLTPWLPFSYEVDLILFGLETKFFYAHQLVSIGIAAFTLYLLLSLWVTKPFSIFGAVLFLLGAPTAVAAQQLMTRHYVEGMIFAVVSLYFYVLYLRRKNIWYLALSTALYVGAIISKEVYVPLVLLLAFIPESSLRSRILSALPHLIVVAAYILWRSYMLSSVSGGYTDPSQYLTITNLSVIVLSFLNIPNLLFGSFWLIPTLLYFALLLIYGMKLKSNFFVSGAVMMLILLPMVPLTLFPGILIADRYLFLPWLGICFSIAFFSFHVSQAIRVTRQPAYFYGFLAACFLTFSLLSFMNASKLGSMVTGIGKEFDAQGKFMWDNGNNVAFVPSPNVLSSYWFVSALEDFKLQLTGETSPTSIVDDIYLNETFVEFWQYDYSCECMTRLEQSVPDRLDAFYSTRNADAPLELEYSYHDGYFSWSFGPYEDGQYFFVSSTLGSIPVPASGRLRVNMADGTQFYLRFASPAGWVTYSDELLVKTNTPPSSWRRQ